MDSFDYIVCGGGTAGCVIAGRLAEKSEATVLIIEAGPPRELVAASAIPAGVSQILGTEADWNIQSEPCANLNNRKLHLGRGKFLGGSSGTNAALCIRGVKQDYDDWDMDGWSGEEMFQYMKRVENFRNNDWFAAETDSHGTQGPIVTAPHEPAPISKLVLESLQSKGFPLHDDMFTSGKYANGCGHTIRTIDEGKRTCATDYLKTDKSKSRVTIMTGQYVDRLIIEKVEEGQGLKATSVQVQDETGQTKTYYANKEIVLTAGAYGSPAILLRSGIGPDDELKTLNIPSVLNLPGVGKNLIDHLVMLNFYEVSKPGLTNDHLIWHTGAKEKSMQEYKNSRTGFLSRFPFGVFAFTRLDERLKDNELWQNAKQSNGRDPMNTTSSQPHIEFWNTECYSPKYRFKDFPPDGKFAFAMATTFFSARSRGEVTLRSTDPRVNPKVEHNFLADPLDMLVFSEGCRLANEIALEGAATKDIVVGAWPAAHGHDKFKEREQWQEAIRERADTCYHPAGTCKMGKAEDPMAVVDGNLRVKGIQGLRIADASIMPTLNSGHPQIVVYAIGEKAVDLLLST